MVKQLIVNIPRSHDVFIIQLQSEVFLSVEEHLAHPKCQPIHLRIHSATLTKQPLVSWFYSAHLFLNVTSDLHLVVNPLYFPFVLLPSGFSWLSGLGLGLSSSRKNESTVHFCPLLLFLVFPSFTSITSTHVQSSDWEFFWLAPK